MKGEGGAPIPFMARIPSVRGLGVAVEGLILFPFHDVASQRRIRVMEIRGSGDVAVSVGASKVPHRRAGFQTKRAVQRGASSFAYLLILPTFLTLILFKYYPALSALYHSFFKWDGFTAGEYIGLLNYRDMLRDRVMGLSAVNILKYIIGRCFLNLAFPLLAAELIFHLKRYRAAYLYRVLFTIPMVVPVVVILLVWKFIYDPYNGLLNSVLRVIGLGEFTRAWLGDFSTALYAVIGLGFPWVTGLGIAGFALLIYLAGLQNIPGSLYDAAAVDGISPMGRFVYIDLPLIAAQVKLILILTIINTMQSYVPVMIMTGGGPGKASMVPGLYLYDTAFHYDKFGYASAIGVVMTLVLLVVTYVNNKYIKSVDEM